MSLSEYKLANDSSETLQKLFKVQKNMANLPKRRECSGLVRGIALNVAMDTAVVIQLVTEIVKMKSISPLGGHTLSKHHPKSEILTMGLIVSR